MEGNTNKIPNDIWKEIATYSRPYYIWDIIIDEYEIFEATIPLGKEIWIESLIVYRTSPIDFTVPNNNGHNLSHVIKATVLEKNEYTIKCKIHAHSYGYNGNDEISLDTLIRVEEFEFKKLDITVFVDENLAKERLEQLKKLYPSLVFRLDKRRITYSLLK